jgi:hypothetical protein
MSNVLAPPMAGDGQPGRKSLSWSHPLARPARRLCSPGVHTPLVGNVACGDCWDAAFAADAAFAEEFELPPIEQVEPDLSYVDEVAVTRALSGRSVRLTKAEKATLRGRRVYTFVCSRAAEARRKAEL